MKNLVEIRTSKNSKLYGMLDIDTYLLHIKESKITRIIPLSKDGVTIKIAFENKSEEICIPPQNQLLNA